MKTLFTLNIDWLGLIVLAVGIVAFAYFFYHTGFIHGRRL